MLEDKLNSIIPQLCEDILEMKLSYFSTTGKPGAGWPALKDKTVKYKKENKELFNTETGKLRDSLRVNAEIIDGVLNIYCTAEHQNGDEAIYQLINDYGRDFLNFTEDEAVLITSRIDELLSESFR